MSFTIEEYATREEWLAQRCRSIGASESPALFGRDISPWLTERALYHMKADARHFDEPESERLYWGKRLEPIIAEEITVRKGWQLRDYGRWTMLRSKKFPFITASLDREIVAFDHRGPGVAECKNTSAFLHDEWNDNGAPLRVQIQAQTQLLVTGYSWGCIPVLLGGCEFRLVEFERDDEFIELIVEKCAAFWERVQKRQPPQMDGSDSTTDAIKRLFGSDDGQTIDLPLAALEWDKKIAEAQKAQADAKEIEDTHKNLIREALGQSSVGVLPDRVGAWTWKSNRNGVRTLKRSDKCPTK